MHHVPKLNGLQGVMSCLKALAYARVQNHPCSKWMSGRHPALKTVSTKPEPLRQKKPLCSLYVMVAYGCGSKPMVPFWGRCTTYGGFFQLVPRPRPSCTLSSAPRSMSIFTHCAKPRPARWPKATPSASRFACASLRAEESHGLEIGGWL